MPKRKAPEDEMSVEWDGLVPIIGEPGLDDDVASSYDAFIQNDVGRESLRKMANASNGYFRRVRKRQRALQPETSSSSGGSALSVDRWQTRPSWPLPRRSPSLASHQPRDSSHRFRGERNPHRQRDATPVDRSRLRCPSPTRSSRSSSRQEARTWKKSR